MAASNLFSYEKIELVNKKINVLMPNFIAKYHDNFLENCINGNESNNFRDKTIFGKNK